ncbi:MAG: ribonuclease III, partial [Planctomycetota bacterium]
EFLGDSILALVICHALFEKFESYLEGDLTKIKSTLVSRRTCAKVAKQLNLRKFIKAGKGMTDGRALAGSVSAGLLEAVIAAVCLDGGFEAARDFVLKMFGPLIEQTSAEQNHDNFKSVLQQYVQQKFNITPFYQLLDEKGPDHSKCFESEVIVAGRHFLSAWGINKKDAEQKAAYNALIELGIIEKEQEATAD